MSHKSQESENANLKHWIHEVIFEADTRIGKIFDIWLLVFIVLSVLAVILESVEEFDLKFHYLFFIAEWFFTIIFTIEYGLRIYSVRKPWKYMTSFYGIVDLLALLPTYLSIIFTGSHYFLVVRAMRLLRIARIFKLGRYLNETQILMQALRASRPKITVFIGAVLTVVIFIGAVMYLVESGQGSGFTSIPRSIYWSIVTITTVGYGDIAPVTTLGQFLAAALMIVGYGVLAVPTGIVSVELANASVYNNTQACENCGAEGHADDAIFCKYCGDQLN